MIYFVCIVIHSFDCVVLNTKKRKKRKKRKKEEKYLGPFSFIAGMNQEPSTTLTEGIFSANHLVVTTGPGSSIEEEEEKLLTAILPPPLVVVGVNVMMAELRLLLFV